MFEQLEKLKNRYHELEKLLASPEVVSNREECNKYAKELASLRGPVALFLEYSEYPMRSSIWQRFLRRSMIKNFWSWPERRRRN